MNETRIGLEMFTSLKAAVNHCRIINGHENSFKLLPTRCCITGASSTSKSNQNGKKKKRKKQEEKLNITVVTRQKSGSVEIN